MRRTTTTLVSIGALVALALPAAGTAVAAPVAPAATRASASAPTSVPTTLDGYRALVAESDLSPALKQRLTEAIEALPADHLARTQANLQRVGADHTAAREAVERAIDPSQYECSPTPLDAYVDQILADVDGFTLLFLSLFGGLDLPTYDAVFYGHTLPAEFDGGAANTVVTHTFRDAKKFWDTRGDDITLVSMNSSIFGDDAASELRATKVLALMYGLDPESAADRAEMAEYLDLIKSLIAGEPALAGGDHPIFTLNAFAFTTEGEPAGSPFAGISDRIAFGEGMFDALDAIGVGDIGVKSVLSHEYAHHVQFEQDVFGTATGPEATRRTELMADAMSGYFATHKRGLTLNAKRLVEVVRSFNYVGDCSFTSNGHHGTPNQRARATDWGVDRAAALHKKGHVEPSRGVIDGFEAALPTIVAPDA